MKKKFTIRNIIVLSIIYGMIAYFGPVAGYNVFGLYCIGISSVLTVYSGLTNAFEKDIIKTGIILFIYLFAFSVIRNYPLSLTNLPIILLCILILCTTIVGNSRKFIISSIRFLGAFYALTTVMLNLFQGKLVQFVIGITKGNPNMVLIAGWGSEVSYNAFIISSGCVVSMANVFSKKEFRDKFIDIVLIFVEYIAIMITDKRSFMLMIPAIFLMFIFLFYGDYKSKNRTTFIMTLIPVLFILYLCVFQNAVNNILSDNEGEGIQLRGRDVLWEIAFRMIRQHPLFGNGLRSYDVNFNNYFSTNWAFAGTHNSYIQYTAEMGFVFSIIFFLLCFRYYIQMIVFATKLKKDKLKSDDYIVLVSSIGILTIMFIYALSGNPFSNPHQMLVGAVSYSCGLTIVRNRIIYDKELEKVN